MLRAQKGFTLIEIMIAMAILAVVMMLSAQTMRAGVNDRESIANEIASSSKVSDAMRIMRNDINNAYHYRDIFIAIQNNAQKPDPKQNPGTPPPAQGNGVTPPDPNAPPAFGAQPPAQPPPTAAEPAATPRATPVDTTAFIGESESMYFTTLSNVRTIQDSHESDQAKVAYYLKSCRAHSGNKVVETKCLYRAVSPFLDEDTDKPGDETVLLEHVEQFKLRYIGPGKTTSTDLEFVDSWKTGKWSQDATTKYNFPYAVEVTLATADKEDPKAKRVIESALIPIRFPNNPAKKADGTPQTVDDATAAAAAAQQQQQGQAPTGSFNNGMTGANPFGAPPAKGP